MKRLTREEVRVEQLLRGSRSIVVLGASAERGHPTAALVEYLEDAGYDVFPVRADRADVAGLTSWPSAADVPGRFDILLFLEGAVPDERTVQEAARKHACALWLAPGVPANDAPALAAAHGLELITGHDIVEEHRHSEQVAVGAGRELVSRARKPGR